MTGRTEQSWSAGGPSNIPLKRARTACYPCRYRRNKCEGEPPDPCLTCLTQHRPCEWPAEETRKRRGRKKAVPNGQQPSSAVINTMPSTELTWEDILEASHGNEQSSIAPDLARRLSTVASGPSSLQPPNPDLPVPGAQTPIGRLLASISELNEVQPSSEEQHLSWLFPGLTANPTPASNPYGQSPRALGSISNFPLDWAAIVGGSTHTEATPPDLVSAQSFPPLVNGVQEDGDPQEGSLYSLTSDRYHGSSAIIPGTERATLRMTMRAETVANVQDSSLDRHLVDLFFIHFGSQFPSMRHQRVLDLLQTQTHTTPFLVNATAAVAARFSRDPRIALSGCRPWQVGARYRTAALSQIGQLMAIPSHETINGLLLLALSAFGSGSSLESWMFMGMAVRLSEDMRLHMDNQGDDDRTVAERLTFWSLVMLEYTLCMWEGRKPSIPSAIITRRLPDQADCRRFSQPLDNAVEPPRHPFPFLAETMLGLGPLLDTLNADDLDTDEVNRTLRDTCAQMTRKYDALHIDVAWNAANLHLHHEAGQGSIYLFLHIFNHAIQSLVQSVDSQRAFTDFAASGKPSREVAFSLGANLWLHSPRFIGDMLVLAKLTDPRIYLSTPFISHCFFLAAKAFVTDERLRAQLASPSEDSSPENGEKHKNELFRTLTKHNMRFFQQAISDLSEHWACVERVKEQLKRFVENENDAFPLVVGRDEAIPTVSQIQLRNIHRADLPLEMVATRPEDG